MKIPLYKVYTDQDDINAVTEVIKRGGWWTNGPEVKKFEEMIAEYTGTKHAVSFNSGTSALHGLMLAYKLKAGDEVIIPSFTFQATANAPLFVGANPVFAEIEHKTYGLDAEDVHRRINHKTRAIMPIHYGGTPSRDIQALKDLAEDYRLFLFEDAAESLGARINRQFVGTIGDAGMFSFCGNKVITTGEAGMIVTNSDWLNTRLQLIRSHGRELKPYFRSSNILDHVIVGYNWRIPTIVGALGITQMKKLDTVIRMRQKNSKALKKMLHGIDSILRLPIFFRNFRQVFQMFTIEVEEQDELKDYLTKKGISTKVYFPPVHLTRVFKRLGHRSGELPVTEQISKQVLTLPMYPELTIEEMRYIKESITSYFEAI
jgi:perosamine synthetase